MGLISGYLTTVCSPETKTLIFLEELKWLLKMYKLCMLFAFLGQPDLQCCSASVHCLALMFADLRGETLNRGISRSCCERARGKEDRRLVATQLQGLLASPGKAFPLSSGGVTYVCRINPEMDLQRKIKQVIYPFQVPQERKHFASVLFLNKFWCGPSCASDKVINALAWSVLLTWWWRPRWLPLHFYFVPCDVYYKDHRDRSFCIWGCILFKSTRKDSHFL